MISKITQNLANVRHRILQACSKNHRDPQTLTLLAVSKHKSIQDIQEVYDVKSRISDKERSLNLFIPSQY